METKNLLSMVFLIVLSYSALSYSMPTNGASSSEHLSTQHNTARKMWNAAKMAYKRNKKQLNVKRTRRQAPQPSAINPDIALANANVTAPKYFVDLYKNLTVNSTNGGNIANANYVANANTIRSLPYSPIAQQCGEFNFSMVAFASSEYLIKAEIHLWLSIHHPAAQPGYFFGIKPEYPDGRESRMIRRWLDISDCDQYVVFDVTDELIRNLERGAPDTKSVLFKISIHKDIDSYTAYENSKGEVPYTCGAQDVKFAWEAFTKDNMPVLITYSYNNAIRHVDYNKIADSLPPLPDVAPTPANPSVDDLQRRKRQVGPTCKVMPLVLDTSRIFQDYISSDDGEHIAAPTMFDAGVCGGFCDSRPPDGSMSNHAPFLALLVDHMSLASEFTQYTFTHCCAPVRYSSLRVFTTAATIVTIKDMIVEECECLDAVV